MSSFTCLSPLSKALLHVMERAWRAFTKATVLPIEAHEMIPEV